MWGRQGSGTDGGWVQEQSGEIKLSGRGTRDRLQGLRVRCRRSWCWTGRAKCGEQAAAERATVWGWGGVSCVHKPAVKAEDGGLGSGRGGSAGLRGIQVKEQLRGDKHGGGT